MASTSLRMTQIEEQHRLQQFLGNIMMGPRSAPRDHSLSIEMLKLSIPLVMQTVPRKALHDSLDRMATILIYDFHYIHHKDGRVSLEVMEWAMEVSLMVVMVIARRSQTCFVLAEFLSSLYYFRYEMQDTLMDLEISTFWLKVALSVFRGLAVGDTLPVDELSQLETEQAVLCSTAADQSNSYAKSGTGRHRACLEDSHRIHGILSKTRSYRYNTTGNLMELQGAIRHMRDSLKRLDNVVYIVDLAELLSRRAIRCAIAGDLKLAISIVSLGLSHCPRSSKYYASCAATVADMYYDIFQVTCGFRLAKHAPKHLWSPEEHDELCLVAISPVKDLKVLGNYLNSKDSSDDEVLPDGIGNRDQPSEPVQWSGTEWKVLQRAVVVYGLAIKLATTDSEKQEYQAKLAEVLLHRFDHLQSGDDLSEAVKLLLGLVDARTGSENAQGKVLERFLKTARALGLQYDTFGDVEALQSSISLLRRSLKMATKASDIIQASLYLSAVLSSHFRLFQDSKYQKEYIDLLYSALDQTPESVDQRWSIRARLAVALYHRCLNTDDLNGVASSLREAWETYVVNLNHSQQKEVEWMIWHIGAQAYAHYDPAKCGAYHDFSIVEMARPLEEPGDTVPLCGPVYPFANAWRRFENVGSLGGASQDLDNAIQFGTEALQIIPKDHPHRPRLLHQLATFHADSFRTYRSSNSILGYDERKALEFLDEAENTSSISHDRICVRRSKMKLLGQMGRWNDAVIVAEAAIEHISVLARENVQFKDRLRQLRSVHGLAADACYLSVRAERSPFQSLRVLEM